MILSRVTITMAMVRLNFPWPVDTSFRLPGACLARAIAAVTGYNNPELPGALSRRC